MNYVPRLKTKYQQEVAPSLMKQFNYSSVMQVPRIEKICINQGIGDATGDKKLVDNAAAELTLITGQKAVPTKAKKSVSNFKLREGMPIGVRVTLRGNQMYEFLDRFLNISLPRVRDFRGVNDKSFDGHGNYFDARGSIIDRMRAGSRGRLRGRSIPKSPSPVFLGKD